MLKDLLRLSLALVLSGLFTACASGKFTQEGTASYYSNKLQGNKMANGDPYRKGKMIAAHRTLPFGTKIKVTNQKNGKSVKVRIADRGPFVKGRIVDVSYKAADRLDMVKAGTVPVKIKVIRKVKASENKKD